MDNSRERTASTVRMCLFGVAGGYFVLAEGVKSDMLLAVIFLLLAANEMYYLMVTSLDYKREMAPKTKPRKKSRKPNPVRKYVIQLGLLETLACTVLYVLWKNSVPINMVWVSIVILVAAFISVLF